MAGRLHHKAGRPGRMVRVRGGPRTGRPGRRQARAARDRERRPVFPVLLPGLQRDPPDDPVNRYGQIAQQQWSQSLPEVYAEIRDPDGFFAVLGDLIAAQVDELAGEIAGDAPPGEGYLAKARRLAAARGQAEESILRDRFQLVSEDDDDREGLGAPAGGAALRDGEPGKVRRGPSSPGACQGGWSL